MNPEAVDTAETSGFAVQTPAISGFISSTVATNSTIQGTPTFITPSSSTAPEPTIAAGGSPVGSPNFSTGLTPGDITGIAIGVAVVTALFVWWFWPKNLRRKLSSIEKASHKTPTTTYHDTVTEVKAI